jgi:hypothetical protein
LTASNNTYNYGKYKGMGGFGFYRTRSNLAVFDVSSLDIKTG